MKSVSIFCGITSEVSEIFKRHAAEVGRLCAKAGLTVVFGGGNLGLMDDLAKAASENGGKLIGVVPSRWKEANVIFEKAEIEWVETLAERKKRFDDLCDAYIILAGGFGTLDEFSEVISLSQLGIIQKKPIVIVNTNGFWDHLLKQIAIMVENNFAKSQHQKLIRVVNSPEQLFDALKEPHGEFLDESTRWWEKTQAEIDAKV